MNVTVERKQARQGQQEELNESTFLEDCTASQARLSARSRFLLPVESQGKASSRKQKGCSARTKLFRRWEEATSIQKKCIWCGGTA